MGSTSILRVAAAALAGLLGGAAACVLVMMGVLRIQALADSPAVVFIGLGAFFGGAILVAVPILNAGKRGTVAVAAHPLPAEGDGAFSAACRELDGLLHAKPTSPTWALVLLGVFFFVEYSRGSLLGVVLLMAVLALHEGGHLLGMRAFGYRDLRVFFIPFFGAAATGTRTSASGRKEAIVLLLGPVPGLILAGVLYATGMHRASPIVAELAWVLAWVNAINLLPMVPLDGGRFVSKALFSNRPLLEALFAGATGLIFAVSGIAIKAYLIAVLGTLIVGTTGARLSVARAGQRVRARCASLPERLDGAPVDYLAELYREASQIVRGAQQQRRCALTMRNIHERAAEKPVSGLVSALLVLLYVASVVVAALVLLVGLAVATHR
jgi:Zn-dependent protease